MGCDTLLMVGTSIPYSEFLPEEGKARGVQIDLAPKMLSIRYPMELALAGDSKASLAALLPQIADAWEQAFAADRPVVIDASTDPEEPPIPPHVTFKQMEALTKAFAAAPREGLPGVVEAAREFVKEFKPGE